MRLPDFEDAALRFAQRGGSGTCLGEAVWHYKPPHEKPNMRIALTAGIHGDETAPIEMLTRRLGHWASNSRAHTELLVAIGNLDALAARRRFIRHDMNRMFGAGPPGSGWAAEGARAEVIRQCLGEFFWSDGFVPALHIDLHTTIRPSLKPSFAVVPTGKPDPSLMSLLSAAGLNAVIVSSLPGVTLSSLGARLGAASCTVELGSVGSTDHADEVAVLRCQAALDQLICTPDAASLPLDTDVRAMEVFRVTREIVRGSEGFELLIPNTSPNFAPLALGQPVARDGAALLRASVPGECIVFPNPSVAVGLRAVLLIAPAPHFGK
jgi:succinylglutamate desuccinylase